MTVETPSVALGADQCALDTLTLNDRGAYTAPHHDLYHGQWLWDSAFIAIGLRHRDPQRAGAELLSLQRGQWQNGMIPNIIFEPDNPERRLHLTRWGNYGKTPSKLLTSGVTQPPLLAEAGWLVGEKMSADDRRDFHAHLLPTLKRYHQWIYNERTGDDGLFSAVHPYETGMDNTPPWIEHMKTLDWSASDRLAGVVTRVTKKLHHDTQLVAADQRSSTEDRVLQARAQWSLIRNHYQADRLRDNHPLHVQDVLVNSTLIRNNRLLQQMAESIHQPLGDELSLDMATTEENFEKLWSEEDGQYLARDAISGKFLRPATITSLLSLYSGIVPPKRATRIVNQLGEHNQPAGLATVPVDNPHYQENGYWKGANWISTSWLAIEGLHQSGFVETADELADKTLATIAHNGMREYFSARTGEGGGIDNFSWTAALYLDLDARRQGR